jgi:hypothetical protein
MSVCHMPNYLKWQSPRKTLYMIIASWVLPVCVRTNSMTDHIIIWGNCIRCVDLRLDIDVRSVASERRWMFGTIYCKSLRQCITLCGLLLDNSSRNVTVVQGSVKLGLTFTISASFQGIHKAARNLEKRAVAKERGHIALLLSQRLGTQVCILQVNGPYLWLVLPSGRRNTCASFNGITVTCTCWTWECW